MSKIGDLIPDAKNARAHNPRNVGMIVNALHEVGAARSIVIDEDGNILAGNATIEAAAEAGIENLQIVEADGETIVAVRRSGLTDAQKRRLAYFDNQSAALADWDPDQIIADLDAGLNFDDIFTDVELEDFGWEPDKPEDPGADMDKADELQEKWRVTRGQIWEIPSKTVHPKAHRIMCGDSTVAEDVKWLMHGERAGMVFTDPPYATFVSSTGKLEISDFNMLIPFWRLLLGIIGSMLQIGRGCFVCCDWRTYPMLFQVAAEKMAPKNLIVWDFGGAVKLGTQFRPSYELLLYMVNADFAGGWTGRDGGDRNWKIKDRSVKDLWTIPQTEAAPGKHREHPSAKPVALADYAMQNCSNKGDMVLDLFLGSGTTIVAAEQTGRVGRGMEIAEKYCSVSLQRLSDMGLEPRVAD